MPCNAVMLVVNTRIRASPLQNDPKGADMHQKPGMERMNALS